MRGQPFHSWSTTAHFSCTRPEGKCFRVCEPPSLSSNHSLLLGSANSTIGSTQTSKCVHVPINTYYSTENKSVDFISTGRELPSQLFTSPRPAGHAHIFPPAPPTPLQTGLALPFFLTHSQQRQRDTGSPASHCLQSQWLPWTCPSASDPQRETRPHRQKEEAGCSEHLLGNCGCTREGREPDWSQGRGEQQTWIVRGAADPRPTVHFPVLAPCWLQEDPSGRRMFRTFPGKEAEPDSFV